MPEGDPISLTAAIVVAVVGAILGLAVVWRLFLDVRRRKALFAEQPETSQFDRDIQRYLRRCWLLYAGWRTEVRDSSPLDEHWGVIWQLAEDLQARRGVDDDTSDAVADLVRLENELERLIDEARA